jgi:hypothetical protein
MVVRQEVLGHRDARVRAEGLSLSTPMDDSVLDWSFALDGDFVVIEVEMDDGSYEKSTKNIDLRESESADVSAEK